MANQQFYTRLPDPNVPGVETAIEPVSTLRINASYQGIALAMP